MINDMNELMQQISQSINGAIQQLGPDFIKQIELDINTDDKPTMPTEGLQNLAKQRYNKHK